MYRVDILIWEGCLMTLGAWRLDFQSPTCCEDGVSANLLPANQSKLVPILALCVPADGLPVST